MFINSKNLLINEREKCAHFKIKYIIYLNYFKLIIILYKNNKLLLLLL